MSPFHLKIIVVAVSAMKNDMANFQIKITACGDKAEIGNQRAIENLLTVYKRFGDIVNNLYT